MTMLLLRSAFVAFAVVGMSGCMQSKASGQISDSKAPLGANEEIAIFAGGCYWTMEKKFDDVPGVIDVVAGVSGGTTENPSEEQFAQGKTGHMEAVQVRFDRSRISYRQLVDRLWYMIDPTDSGGQACDRGGNYRTAVFATEAQLSDAEASRVAISARLKGVRLITPILTASRFWPVPEERQDFAKRNPDLYHRYNNGCGRDARLRTLWGDAH